MDKLGLIGVNFKICVFFILSVAFCWCTLELPHRDDSNVD